MLILGGVLAIEHFAAHIYYRLAVIIAYVLNIVFWLSGWAWCASIAATFLATTCTSGVFTNYCYAPSGAGLKFGSAMAAAAALGAISWYVQSPQISSPFFFSPSEGLLVSVGSLWLT
jgi:hypothetical protein